MLHKNTHRLIAAGFVAASLLVAAQPAQAGCDPYGGICGPVNYPSAKLPWKPVIGTATSGVPGGTITASAVWSSHYDAMNTAKITGYRVRANAYKSEQVPRYDAYNQRLYWVWVYTLVGSTTSAVQPADARTLSMTLPNTGAYTFHVQAINDVGDSAYSAESNRVTGQ